MSALPVDLSRLIGAVELQKVRLVETSAKTKISSPGDVGDQAMCVIHANARIGESPRKQTSFVVIATVGVDVSGTGKVEGPAVSIKASFELEYNLPKGFAAKPKELQGFAEINGIFNAWPYWREYVQSVFTRMGLPPITLPVYRLKDRAVMSAEPPKVLPAAETSKPRKSRKARSTASV